MKIKTNWATALHRIVQYFKIGYARAKGTASKEETVCQI